MQRFILLQDTIKDFLDKNRSESANYFKDKYLETVEQLKNQSYVDNIRLTDLDEESLEVKTLQADKVLEHANMKLKGGYCIEIVRTRLKFEI